MTACDYEFSCNTSTCNRQQLHHVQIFYLLFIQKFQIHVITPTMVCVFKQTPHFPLNHHHNQKFHKTKVKLWQFLLKGFEDIIKPWKTSKTYTCTRSLQSNLLVLWRSLLVCSQSYPANILQKCSKHNHF